ncbi:DUF1016 N-terminal domain-containing protein [Chitinophaga sp.]|uniref:DUF1016 N-terminal domain-containing protein n=1 Tax=Chitinophaga sp. TaxID=1869181 RepID=UPI0031D45556
MRNYIIKHQYEQGWGAKLISLLAADLKKAFPSVKGFFSRNLLYMKQFAEVYPIDILQTYNQLEEELSKENSSSYDWKNKLMSIEKQSVIITQQVAAQLGKKIFLRLRPSLIVQQVVAQFA